MALQLGLDLQLDLEGEHAIIAAHQGLDVATFRITANEIKRIGKQILTGYQKSWPPDPPKQGRGIYYSGFPGTETIWLCPRAISFGAAPGGGVASSVSDTDVSMLVEQQSLSGVMGGGSAPENYDFRGISGGPVLTVVETSTIRSWAFAGSSMKGLIHRQMTRKPSQASNHLRAATAPQWAPPLSNTPGGLRQALRRDTAETSSSSSTSSL